MNELLPEQIAWKKHDKDMDHHLFHDKGHFIEGFYDGVIAGQRAMLERARYLFGQLGKLDEFIVKAVFDRLKAEVDDESKR